MHKKYLPSIYEAGVGKAGCSGWVAEPYKDIRKHGHVDIEGRAFNFFASRRFFPAGEVSEVGQVACHEIQLF